MQGNVSFRRYSQSALDPSLAFDVVYGARFEHRILSPRHSYMAHQRLALGNVILETGSYDFAVAACGVMPRDLLCIGMVAHSGEVTRCNTAPIDADEIQIYPSGSELLYHASGSSRWISLVLPEALLQSAAMAHMGRPLNLPKRDFVSIRLPAGGGRRLAQLTDDAFAMGRMLEPEGMSDVLAASIFHELVDSYVVALGSARLANRKRMTTAQQHSRLVLACERLAMTEDALNVELDDIARRSGYSRRALELIFNRSTGMPPGRWFLNIRLNNVMRDLLLARPDCRVADIAARWGFRHFSRFAYQYRRAFGELPSETLRRAAS
ncbi:helix-turn-helix transcriptional regulator [Pseudomonas jinjuensis]|uniref:Helix-turn-helix domain-containing protein n=1 Tax=Pseudomonas jinjuensis TaxID=198616 RepID=A0A1H0HUG6_9PSED|nr:helix-turn-helix domain-containing protein [Pseudomonas jinjuensis]SDO22826.1 Helix-turn-helix domain-containing protein [Pseudomonas jinjuensis]